MLLEFGWLVASLVLYILPGYLLTSLLVPDFRKQAAPVTYFYSVACSYAYAILVSFLLVGFRILDSAVVLVVYALTLLLFLLVRIRSSGFSFSDWRMPSTQLRNIVQWMKPWNPVLLISIIFAVGFLLYQDAIYPRGYDGSMHYVRLVQLLSQGDFGAYEIGTNTLPYYARGYHSALATFALILGMAPESSLLVFNTILFSSLATVTYSFSSRLFNRELAASASAACFLFVSRVFLVQGSYPMLMTLFFIAGILIVWKSYLQPTENSAACIAFMTLMFVGLLSTHVISAEIMAFFVIGFIVFEKLNRKRISKALWSIVFCSGVAAAFLIITQPVLMVGQLSFAYLHSSEPEAVSAFLNTLSFRTALAEFVILFVTSVLAPVFVFGFLTAMRKRMTMLVSLNAVGGLLVLAQIIPLNGREPYILFLPLLSTAGLGFAVLYESNKCIHNVRRLLAATLCIMTAVGALQLVYVAENPMIGGWVPLSAEDVEFCRYLRENGIENQVIATYNNPSALLIQALTSNVVLYGDSRYYDIPSFRDIARLFFDNRSETMTMEIIQRYAITAIFVWDDWGNTTALMADISEWFASSSFLTLGKRILIQLNEESVEP